jgi:polygalacturonase
MALAGCGGGDGNPVASTSAQALAKAATSTPTTVVNASSFGVKADGVTNDRVALQNAINNSVGKILLISGNVRIDSGGVDLRTNSYVRFASGATIKLLPHNTAIYQIMRIWDVTNVTVENATLDGSKQLNSATPYPASGGGGGGGGGGHAFSIAGACGVTLKSPTTINCWGDGIYITNSFRSQQVMSSNIYVSNHHANGCRRQGASIISGNGITFDSPLWENIAGTLPSAGLDIEPNTNASTLQNIKINSPTTRNCHFGINVYLANLPGTTPKTVSIDISNHTDYAANDAGFYVSGLALHGYVVTGHITSASPTFVQSKSSFRKAVWDPAGPAVEVTNITTR